MKREPLPYPHKRIAGSAGYPFACQHPEDPNMLLSFDPETCPGCLAALMAEALDHPRARYATEQGEMSFVDAVLTDLDDFAPMAVLFKRALAEKSKLR